MKKLCLYLAVVISGLLFTGCDIDDGVNFHFQPLQIVSAELPETFTLNEIYDIKVTFSVPDNCTLFERFSVDRTETTTRQVAVIGAVLDRTDCVPVNQEVENSFRFEVKYTDTYLFQFWTGEDENGNPEYIEIEVPVIQETTSP